MLQIKKSSEIISVVLSVVFPQRGKKTKQKKTLVFDDVLPVCKHLIPSSLVCSIFLNLKLL